MGGCRCSYRTCVNTTKTRENLHFFHYPVKHKERCKQWIENAQKPQFYDLEEEQLRNKVICETHFIDSYFHNPQKKRLLHAAIPTLDGDCLPPEIEALSHTNKVQDVQVLPANEDGTIFVLESNVKPTFLSERVESYIYTNNGLVLPINHSHNICKPVEKVDIEDLPEEQETIENVKNPLSDIEMEETNIKESSPPLPTTKPPPVVTIKYIKNPPIHNHHKPASKGTSPPTPTQVINEPAPKPILIELPVESKSLKNLEKPIQKETQAVDRKYIAKIRQNSRDIALLKSVIESGVSSQRLNETNVLNLLKKKLPPTLFGLVQLHFPKSPTTHKQWKFYKRLHSTSPDLYKSLMETYNWKLPQPNCLKIIK